jgi:hypothetical protein
MDNTELVVEKLTCVIIGRFPNHQKKGQTQMIAYIVERAKAVLIAAGFSGQTVEIAPIASPEGKVVKGTALFSASKEGKVYVKLKLGSTVATVNQAFESLALNGARFLITGFTRTDAKKGTVAIKRLTGGKPSDLEIGQSRALIARIASANPDDAQQLSESLKALVMEATQRSQFFRKVVIVDAKSGKSLGLPALPVSTKTYGLPGSELAKSGNQVLSGKLSGKGLAVRDYDEALDKPSSLKIAEGSEKKAVNQ